MNLHQRLVLHTGLAVRKKRVSPWRSFTAWELDIDYLIDINSLTILWITTYCPAEGYGRKIVRAFSEHASKNSLSLTAADVDKSALPFWRKVHFEQLPNKTSTWYWNGRIP